MLQKLILFLILNFAALGIGGLFTSKGVSSIWYQNLNKAPWTPPGWVFGLAWTVIMFCFAFYMTYATEKLENWKTLVVLFAFQWVLNVSWNPVFFKFQNMGLGLVIIIALTLVVGFILFFYAAKLKYLSLLLAPYFIWLLIATSLNGYSFFKN